MNSDTRRWTARGATISHPSPTRMGGLAGRSAAGGNAAEARLGAGARRAGARAAAGARGCEPVVAAGGIDERGPRGDVVGAVRAPVPPAGDDVVVLAHV